MITNKFLVRILKNIYLFINLFIVKVEKIVYISYPDFSDNSYYLFLYHLKSLKNKKKIWLVDKEKYDLQYENTSFVKRRSLRGLFHFFTAKYVFHTHGTFSFVKSGIKNKLIVNLWHGMPIKNIGYLDNKFKYNVDSSDFYIATSKLFQYIIAAAFMVNINKVLLTGLPRNDVLYTHKSVKKKIIWLPTYRHSNQMDIRSDSNECCKSIFETSLLRKLDDLLGQISFELVIKIHPMDVLNNTDIAERYNNINIYNNTRWVDSGLKLYSLLAESYAMITDVSSVVFDFMITGRPICLFFSDSEQYNRGYCYNFDFSNYTNIIKANSEDELILFFRNLNKYKQLDVNLGEYNNSDPGNACSTLTDIIFNGDYDDKL